MIGNAVPVKFAEVLANTIKKDLNLWTLKPVFISVNKINA